MPNTLRIKRRATGGGAGAPSGLANAELAYNEQTNILYYGWGTGGAGGTATQVIPIAGSGSYTFVDGSNANGTWPISINGNSATVTNGVYTSRSISAGDGLSGGGDLSANRTLSVDSSVVRTTGTQTLAGIKTFSNTPIFNAGATVTGDLTVSGSGLVASNINNFDSQVRTSRLDQMSAPTADVSLNSRKITNLATPTTSTDATTKAYVDGLLGANNAMVFKGGIDCSSNPNYPAADSGDTYKVTVAGKIGGASGPNVEINDTLVCTLDSSAAGTHAAVGSNWIILQTNIDGAVTGPVSSTDNRFALFNGTSGKIIKDAGFSASTVGQNLVSLTNPSAVTFIKVNADNSVSTESNSAYRTSLGATTVGSNLFTLTNPSAISFLRVNADNTVTTRSAANFLTDIGVNDATLTLNVSGSGLSGSQTFTANQSTGATFTVTSNATAANTASAIVTRDSSGNFSAGTITASLNGNASTVTNGVYTSNKLNALSSTSSAELAGVISDETGSGNLVFSTNPQFTNSITTNSSSFNIFNTTATGINAFGAATTLNIGSTGVNTSTTNIATSDVGGFEIKTVNIGTGGGLGTTNVNLGSSTGAGVTTINSRNFTVSDGSGGTVNIGTSTPAISTKTINIGTSGASPSTTNINIGSSAGGSITINNNVTLNGTLSSQALPTSSTATQIPVFTADPSGTTRSVVTRTPAQLLTDIGAAATNQTMFIGTTSVAINRSSASLSLTGVSIDGNAGTVTSGVYTSGSYADPAWITSLAKSKVGLGNVENTALSTWAGSTSLTTLGTIGTGTWNATTIAVDKGGTGQTSYTNGQLLIGNTTGNTLTKATLTTGTGISITNGAGSITVAHSDTSPLSAGTVGASGISSITIDDFGHIQSVTSTTYLTQSTLCAAFDAAACVIDGGTF